MGMRTTTNPYRRSFALFDDAMHRYSVCARRLRSGDLPPESALINLAARVQYAYRHCMVFEHHAQLAAAFDRVGSVINALYRADLRSLHPERPYGGLAAGELLSAETVQTFADLFERLERARVI